MPSQAAYTLLFGWSPESESDSVSTSQDTEDNLETFIAGGRTGQCPDTNSPPLERIGSPIFQGNANRERAKTLISRGVQQAKGLARSTSHSLRTLPIQWSREIETSYNNSNNAQNYSRLGNEAINTNNNNLIELIARWKDPKSRLQPSPVWKRTHPRLNYHLQAIIHRNRLRTRRPAASVLGDFEEARDHYLAAGCPREEMYWSNQRWQEDYLDRLARQYLDYLAVGGTCNPYA